MILALIFYVAINLAFLYLICKHEENPHLYDTRNCRDTRANLDMFAYKHQVEERRKVLDSPATKF